MDSTVAIVTGGTRGVGKTVTKTLSQMGFQVYTCARTEADLEAISSEVEGVRTQQLDLLDHATTRAWIQSIYAERGRVDVLVNNAGVMAAVGPLHNVDMDEWQGVVELNLVVPARICRQVVPLMVEQRQGCVINLAGGGSAYPRKHFTAYACSKAGILRLTDTLAEELREFGIRVNAVTPGLHQSRIWRHAEKVGEHPPNLEPDPPEAFAKLIRYVVGTPFLTGKFLHIDDDYESIDDDVMTSDLFTLRRISPSGRTVRPEERASRRRP